MKKIILPLLLIISISSIYAQHPVRINEGMQTLKTYPFSDPDPVANPSLVYYPYFRFDGFSSRGIQKQWKVIELENDFIKLSLFPEIGGKIWGAVEKSSGREFIYYNHVVKFRDIAMRGPWTSGGIEFNFGIIGHAPTTSTPVDYLTKQKSDGSVSCYITCYELITRTLWTVEINLPPGKAYFTTHVIWHNSSAIDQPYYQWMNAGYKAEGDLQFCFPGTHYIGHGGELASFPVDGEGRDLSWYDNNNFGYSKSYHVLGRKNDFYGAYWHKDSFGSVHHADYDQKLGMKIFLWGLSREGGIWEELLTDTDGQYVELQSGRMYNQPASGSAYSPYKHTAFSPLATDSWTEYWYPVKDIRGIAKATSIGAFNYVCEDNFLKLYLSPVQPLSTTLKLFDDGKLVREFALEANVLEVWKDSIPLQQIPSIEKMKVIIGDDLLTYSESLDEEKINRPKQSPEDFNWESAYGLYIQGTQWLNQKGWNKAETYLLASLEKEPYFIPSLYSLASLYYREGKYNKALELCRIALSINTYDGEVNYLYGLCNQASGNLTDAKDGFSLATFSSSTRTAAYTKLAEVCLLEQNYTKAEEYALKSLKYDDMNLTAINVLMVSYRKNNKQDKAEAIIQRISEQLPLYYFARFEECLLKKINPGSFTSLITNELPHETYIEMADWYESVGCPEEAVTLLDCAGEHPIAYYKKACLMHLQGYEKESQAIVEKANSFSSNLVFPFRPATLKALEWSNTISPDWKIDYYMALIYWVNQNQEKALSLLQKHEDIENASYYLSRALLKQGEARLADIHKAEKIESSWRTVHALLDYHLRARQWDEAVRVGKKYIHQYPSNYYIGLKYAKALCEAGDYSTCINFLKKMEVLPNEGAYTGRAVYRSANLLQAINQLTRKNYTQALKSISQSEEWPENLGVGKPYDNLIDNRIENFLRAEVYTAWGKPDEANKLYQSVIDYGTSGTFNSADLLNAISLRTQGRTQEAERLVATWQQRDPDDQVIQWCTAVYNGDKEQMSRLSTIYSNNEDTTPWESSLVDVNFDLIIRLF